MGFNNEGLTSKTSFAEVGPGEGSDGVPASDTPAKGRDLTEYLIKSAADFAAQRAADGIPGLHPNKNVM